MTRILADQRNSLNRRVQTNRHRDVSSTSKNVQAGLLKNMVPDPGWFNGDQSKFEDWWRGIRLFLKSNRVNGRDNRITVILACLRGGVVGIYTQKKC